jgi:UDP-galactopyranose mutase
MGIEILPDRISPAAIIYDCMDELSAFRGASPRICNNEEKVLQAADLVFTGGVSLYEAKRGRHARVYPFPSGVDVEHFARARNINHEVADQAGIPHPRIGFAGVIDERMDLNLLRDIARLRPDWHFVMIGPVVKIEPESLPRAESIHWLGMKDYRALPDYFAGWDAAMMPWALNEATRYISPTKTPEYLSAGLPVISTAIRDVVRPYGELGLAHIAHTPEEFVAEIDRALRETRGLKWRERVDLFLHSLSWDSTWSSMDRLITDTVATKQHLQTGVISSAQEAAHVG